MIPGQTIFQVLKYMGQGAMAGQANFALAAAAPTMEGAEAAVKAMKLDKDRYVICVLTCIKSTVTQLDSGLVIPQSGDVSALKPS